MDYAIEAFVVALVTSLAGGVTYMIVQAYQLAKRKRLDRQEKDKRAELGYQLGVENNVLLRNIMKELKPNGTKSLRDAIDRLERHLVVNNHIVLALANRSDVGVFIANNRGELVTCNALFRQMIGVSEDDLKGNKWRAYIHPGDRDAVIEAWTQAVDQQYDFHKTYRFLCDNGEVIEADVHAQIVPNDQDRIIAFVGIVTITD